MGSKPCGYNDAARPIAAALETVTSPGCKVLSANEFDQWAADIPSNERVHIKGFGKDMKVQLCEAEALKLLSPCKLLIWDGDPFHETGFTALVPRFLQAGPDARVVAFRLQHALKGFHESWAQVSEAFPGRVAVVAVDMDRDAKRFPQLAEETAAVPSFARKYFPLGRLALLYTGAKSIVCMGGGGIAEHEAAASIGSAQKDSAKTPTRWTIFALSRGREDFPTLMDWASTCNSPHVELIRGIDPDEAHCFTGAMPTSQAK